MAINRKLIIDAIRITCADEYETAYDFFELASKTDNELIEVLINALYYFHDEYNKMDKDL